MEDPLERFPIGRVGRLKFSVHNVSRCLREGGTEEESRKENLGN